MASVSNITPQTYDTLIELTQTIIVQDKPNKAKLDQIIEICASQIKTFGTKVLFHEFNLVRNLAMILSQPQDHPSMLFIEKRIQRVLGDIFRTNKLLDSVTPIEAQYIEFGQAIFKDNLQFTQQQVLQGLDPNHTSMAVAESYSIPITTSYPPAGFLRTCLGIAAAGGADNTLNWLLARGIDPNFSIQYTNLSTFDTRLLALPPSLLDLGPTTTQKSFHPAWLTAARTSSLAREKQLTIVSQMLFHGADPLLQDTDGNFWLTHCVRPIEFSPEIMHLLLSHVTDLSKSNRVTYEGQTVSILDDMIANFDRMRNRLFLRSNTDNPMMAVLTQRFGSLNILAADATFALPLSDTDKTNIQKWQRSFLANAAVMVAHGITCTQASEDKIKTLLTLNISHIILHLDPETTVTPDKASAIVDEEQQKVQAEISAWTDASDAHLQVYFATPPQTAESLNSTAVVAAKPASALVNERPYLDLIALINAYAVNERLILAQRIYERLFSTPNVPQTAATGTEAVQPTAAVMQ